MPGVELALAIVATLDLCFKYGNTLVQICATFKGAETEIVERVLCIENHWKRTSLQLDFIRRVWEHLDNEHRNIQNQILQVLDSKLRVALSKIENAIEKESGNTVYAEKERQRPWSGRVKRWKYVQLKESLDKAMEDLETWQRMFDPTWFLILKIASPLVDDELAKDNRGHVSLSSAQNLRDALKDNPQKSTNIFLPEGGLKSAQIFDIRYSSAKLAQREGSNKWLILESIIVPPQANVSLFSKDIRDLARKLSCADPITFGLLSCYGVVRNIDPATGQPTSFCFVFRAPEGMSGPWSLRSGFNSSDADHSLSDQFKIAKELAKSVSGIHTYGFVHKNIRPETILTFRDGKSSLGSPFLLGFENIRTADGRTLRSGDSAWERNLYRHPRRQGLKSEDDYVMQHDIYSLGVCLLEVGLWESFVTYDQEGMKPSPSPILGLTLESFEDKGSLIKDHLVSLARNLLPRRMGTRYAQIVETCLTCLDEDNADFGDEREFQDADGILVAVRYIEKVSSHLFALIRYEAYNFQILLQLNSISV